MSLILFCFVLCPILVFIIPTFVCAVLIKGDVLVVLVRVLVVVLDLPPWAVDEEGIVCVGGVCVCGRWMRKVLCVCGCGRCRWCVL